MDTTYGMKAHQVSELILTHLTRLTYCTVLLNDTEIKSYCLILTNLTEYQKTHIWLVYSHKVKKYPMNTSGKLTLVLPVHDAFLKLSMTAST